MTRVRPLEGVLAALASVLACLPLTTLFTSATWVRPALFAAVLVAGTGMLARRFLSSTGLVVTVQVLVLAETLVLAFARDHLWYGLPGLETALDVNDLLYQARVTVEQYAAPAPTNPGTTVALTMIVALVALAVDATAVTRRAPALAGLPLLVAYLVTASNSGDPLPWYAFAAPAAAWLVLVAHQGVGGLRRWTTVSPLTGADSGTTAEATRGFVHAARVLGAAAVVAALLVPTVTPHLPTRFLVGGLGRTESGTGPSGSGELRLSTAIDLSRNLRSQSTRTVLSYRTEDGDPQPLRVAVLDRFVDGVAVPSDRAEIAARQHFSVPDPPGLDVGRLGQKAAPTYRIEVVENRLQPPQLAAPGPVVSGDLGGMPWAVDEQGVVRVAGRTSRYGIDYLHLDPPRSVLESSDPSIADEAVGVRDLVLDPGSEQRVRAATAKVVPAGAGELQAAVAIQDWLRGSAFTYSLELAGPTRDRNGRVVQRDPITHFLQTKRGYCQQFATTMVMMARAEGIPARLALGFLPGTPVGNVYEVKASDAHAWPELYFTDVGWLRFEPTPSQRTGVAPQYTDLTQDVPSNDPGAGTGPDGSAPNDTTSRQPNTTDLGTGTTGTDTNPSLTQRVAALPRGAWAGLGTLLVLLVALMPPLAAWLSRRRRARELDLVQRAEGQWQDMMRRIDDLGIRPPPGATPRQTGDYLRHEAYLRETDAAALGRVVATLERARYAPPGAEIPDITTDTGVVVRAVTASRRRGDRVRAWWLPQDGTSAWRSLGDRVLGAPGRWWRRYRPGD